MTCNPAVDQEPTVRDLIIEQLRHIAGALPARLSIQAWYDDGCPFELFDFGDDTQREAVSFAYGYLRGAHEMLDVTMSELFDEHGIEIDLRATKRLRKG